MHPDGDIVLTSTTGEVFPFYREYLIIGALSIQQRTRWARSGEALAFGMIVSTSRSYGSGGLVDGFTVLATMVVATGDHNKPRQCREDQKMVVNSIGRTIAVSERGSERLEHRVTALENIVNFLVTEMREDQQRRIKLRQSSPDGKASYDSWPDDPGMW